MTDTKGKTAAGEVATLGGGCFWCLEAVFDGLAGVDAVESGYSGGHLANPTYEDICGGDTGHAEVVRITFDPAVLSYADLLDVFFVIHDPTTLNAKGNDFGTQYRSVIYFHTPEQKDYARWVQHVSCGRMRTSLSARECVCACARAWHECANAAVPFSNSRKRPSYGSSERGS